MPQVPPTLPLVQSDSWLAPYAPQLLKRLDRLENTRQAINHEHASLDAYAAWHRQMGLHYEPENQGWRYREWAPAAQALSLIGDFNFWDRAAHPLQKKENGIWEVFLPQDQVQVLHGHRFKVHVVGATGEGRDRVSPFAFRAVQDQETYDFSGQYWAPEESFSWTDEEFDATQLTQPLIYECHVGMAQEKHGVGTYREFADQILPRIAETGYNCLQLMALMEHPYYGSFGYHVSSFFAPTSRFGTPEDLKYLVNQAHRLGIAVIMDLIHAHAVKNVAEGLADFDGSGGQYFHQGPRGHHPGWDSKLFNYGVPEVRRFLLSNVRYWLEEFHLDGFRYDGVTSMLYHHHGEGVAFGHYDRYFDKSVDEDAILYLQLASDLAHSFTPGSLLIAEDMSGMPGLCRPIADGGIGFDYRLGMGIPDYWIKTLKHKRDEDWNLDEIWYELTNRREGEKTVAYAESHDQSLVGDKTIAFWLMDKEMYFHMRTVDQHPVIDRGMALHKMIRLITLSLGGEAFLTFMGNEFGHPEWVDFPRLGNNWSYQYARRQWSLVDNGELRYRQLWQFERDMLGLAQDNTLLEQGPAQKLHQDNTNNVLIFQRAGLVFLFNFHPKNSVPDYRFPVLEAGSYSLVLSSDTPETGGHDRVDTSIRYFTQPTKYGPRLSIYLPNRTALVLRRED
ncbi:alpha amylase C-terminal domain-containing protein [Rufibacter glacialis]|uniref:1,4-alpha-glucan branching enzyme n=1 Tax=Rufibacter glacialis TaxID=1259555 RepID=A0A5M8Q6Y2_9BACT|nr:alpha amylase C-terminal domain-containing protein [Rufibacter glacialis]KAA6431695.1 1,4-alpha-glucan-branching enzyme [Rufibacter glacialis]GGK82339.1 1,4-alpha-glucan branching enzyme [Rufibacter glacialis]